jgi:branched-chain amino acid transport system permease protein
MNRGLSGKELGLAIGALALLFALPLFLSRFYVYLIGLIFVYGLLATSLNVVLGYGGVFQFHHCVFYGVGGYTTALFLTKTGVPFAVSFLAGGVAAALLSLLMGIITVRLSKLYFGMLQISLGSLVWVIVYRWYSFTGGDDGIHGISLPDIVSSQRGAYYFTLAVTLVSFFIIYKVIKSPFGSILQGIRDNPVRSGMVGINVKKHILVALIIAGFFGGIAGSLFVVVDRTVFPEMLFWTLSLEVLIMCLIGGWFNFFGPMIGAAIVIALRTFVSGYTGYWALVYGVVMILVIFFLPDGVLGYLEGKFKPAQGRAVAKEV